VRLDFLLLVVADDSPGSDDKPRAVVHCAGGAGGGECAGTVAVDAVRAAKFEVGGGDDDVSGGGDAFENGVAAGGGGGRGGVGARRGRGEQDAESVGQECGFAGGGCRGSGGTLHDDPHVVREQEFVGLSRCLLFSPDDFHALAENVRPGSARRGVKEHFDVAEQFDAAVVAAHFPAPAGGVDVEAGRDGTGVFRRGTGGGGQGTGVGDDFHGGAGVGDAPRGIVAAVFCPDGRALAKGAGTAGSGVFVALEETDFDAVEQPGVLAKFVGDDRRRRGAVGVKFGAQVAAAFVELSEHCLVDDADAGVVAGGGEARGTGEREREGGEQCGAGGGVAGARHCRGSFRPVSARTVMVMPPRAAKAPVTSSQTGSRAAARSSRMTFTRCS